MSYKSWGLIVIGGLINASMFGINGQKILVPMDIGMLCMLICLSERGTVEMSVGGS